MSPLCERERASDRVFLVFLAAVVVFLAGYILGRVSRPPMAIIGHDCANVSMEREYR